MILAKGGKLQFGVNHVKFYEYFANFPHVMFKLMLHHACCYLKFFAEKYYSEPQMGV